MTGGKSKTKRATKAAPRSVVRASRTDRARATFLDEFRKSCNVSASCRAAGINRRQTVYDWREADEAFALAWDEAEQVAIDRLEQEAWRRACEGTEEPVFYLGQECGRVRKYSDKMMEILLKGHRPEKFVDRIKAEHSGVVPVALTFVRRDEAPNAD